MASAQFYDAACSIRRRLPIIRAVVYLTKQVQMANDSGRQAGALTQDEIEVTPQMIQAGVEALDDCENFSPSSLAREVYLAMAEASQS